MRSTIALLLVTGLGIAGCDSGKQPEPQATATVAAESPAAPDNASAEPERIGTVDRSNKGQAAPDHGFLDGRWGLVLFVLHTFWFRFLVDAKLHERREREARR